MNRQLAQRVANLEARSIEQLAHLIKCQRSVIAHRALAHAVMLAAGVPPDVVSEKMRTVVEACKPDVRQRIAEDVAEILAEIGELTKATS